MTNLFEAAEKFDDSYEVGVWHFGLQCYVPHFPCPGEKRVRIDVHDSLSNYGVFRVSRPNGQKPYESGMVFTESTEELKDWRIDLS